MSHPLYVVPLNHGDILTQLKVIRPMTDKAESLKAAEPGSHPRAEKYGMPIENAHHIINRHFGVTEEQMALKGAELAHQIEQSKALRDVADKMG